MKDIKEIIKKIEKLKPFSPTFFKIKKMLNDPYVSAQKIVEVIKYDQSFTANILKICNSALYRRSYKISNLVQAIALLGNNQIKRIILLESINEIMGESYEGYEINERELWLHSVITALVAEDIGIKVGIKDINTLFTAAILHDIGKVILSEYVQEGFEKIMDLIQDQNYDFLAAEKEVIGIDHSEIGAEMLKVWQFPSVLIEAVQFHHNPEQCTDNHIVSIVNISDTISMIMGIMTQRDGMIYRSFPQICKKLDIKEKDIERIISKASSYIYDIEEMIS